MITNIICVGYPMFMSVYALENEAMDDDKQWLTYWIIFGIFSIIDQFAGFILGLIPFYHILKMGFLIWLFHPGTLGAKTLYYSIVQGFYKDHEAKLEDAQRVVESKIREGMQKAGFKQD